MQVQSRTPQAPLGDRSPPEIRAAVDRVARHCAAGRNGAVIRATGETDPADDAAPVLLTYRAVALARVGMFRSALTTFGQALRSPGCSTEVRHFVLRQRAEVYAAEGRHAQARRDVRRILAEDPTVDEAHARLTQLGAR
ncbi:hypothetical protein BH23ACT10_BH23ACT10_06140 [soil metagenome]